MKMKLMFFLLCIFMLSANLLFSHHHFPEDYEWKEYLPYRQMISVEDAGDKVFAATPYSLLVYDKANQETEKLSKVNSLHETGISTIAWNEEHQKLLVAYTNCKFDIISGDNAVCIYDIYNTTILGNKSINSIYYADNTAYFACGFGIVAFDIVDMEFTMGTIYIGEGGAQVNIKDLTIAHDTMYAATKNGIYKAYFHDPDFQHHEAWTLDQQLKPGEDFNLIEFFDEKLIVNNTNEGFQNDTAFLYDFSSHTWDCFNEPDHYCKSSIENRNGKLLITNYWNIMVYGDDWVLEKQIASLTPTFSPRDAVFDANNTLWVADGHSGLIRSTDYSTGTVISPDGPYSTNIFEMKSKGDALWVASGGRGNNWGKLYFNDGVYSFIDNTWNNFNLHTGHQAFDSISDMICVAIDPQNILHAYIGTWEAGVIEILDNEIVNIFNDQNSTLEVWPATAFIAVSGLAFDNTDNLWAVNSGATNLLSVMTTSGEWYAFNLGTSTSHINTSKIYIDSFNNKWILLQDPHKLLVFNENGTFDNPADDMVKTLTSAPGNGNLPGDRIYSITQDENGYIWIGTDDGIGAIYHPENIFGGGNYDAERIIVEIGGNQQYLLQGQTVTDIAIDQKRFKWFGTESNGIYKYSPDGTQEIEYFTADYSPLFSNGIVDIEINNNTSEIYVATDHGLLSLKDESNSIEQPMTTTNDSFFSVFPNPSTGKIYFNFYKAIMQAHLQITDINGNIIINENHFSMQTSLDINRLQNGVYFIKLIAGNQQYVHKIVKF